MTGFTSLHITGDNWRDLSDRALDRLRGAADGQLAFLYLAAELAADADRIVDHLRAHSAIGHWVGCVGMGLCGSGSESYDQPALSILATPYDESQFRIIPALDDGLEDWLDATADWRRRTLASVAVVHGSPLSQRLPALLKDLGRGLDGGFLVGGIASAEQMPLQIADRVVSGGLSGVLFSGEVAISTGLSQGCTLIGEKHLITAAKGNVIATLDDRPALEVFKQDIGEVLARDLRRVGGYIFAALPIAGSDTGDYLVRNLIGLDPDQGLIAIGDRVDAGAEIQFARRDPQTARDDLVHMIDQLNGRLPAAPQAALYHSCLGRGRQLFGEDSAELNLVRERLGDLPLAGFYANGEISHDRLYGYTGVLTLFC